MPKRNKTKNSNGRRSKKGADTAAHDVYSDDDMNEEQYLKKFDVETYEYEPPSDIEEDEEIDEDEAFNSEDEKLFNDVFDAKKKGNIPSDDDDDASDRKVESDAEENGISLLDMMDRNLAKQKKEQAKDTKSKAQTQQTPSVSSSSSSVSGSETESDSDDELDPKAHRKMLRALGYDDIDTGKPMQRLGLQHEAMDENSFGVGMENGTETQKKLSVGSLMNSLLRGDSSNSKKYNELSKKMEALSEAKAVSSRPSRAAEIRAERKVAYDESGKEVSRWQALVKANREASHLSFVKENRASLGSMITGPLTASAMADKFQAHTDMEQEVSAALAAAGMQFDEGIRSSEHHELAVNDISPEELRQRQQKLAKMKMLMFYEEQKRRRANRIKSKAYRRLKKRQKVKENAAELERMKQDNAHMAHQIDEDEALRRATERMTQRKNNRNDWVKKALSMREISGGTTRSALQSELEEKELLHSKIMGHTDTHANDALSSDESDSNSDDDESGQSVQQLMKAKKRILAQVGLDEDGKELPVKDSNESDQKGLMSLKFMKAAADKSKELAREEALGIAKQIQSEINKLMAESDEDISSDDETAQVNSRRRFNANTSATSSSTDKKQPSKETGSSATIVNGFVTVKNTSNDAKETTDTSNPWLRSLSTRDDTRQPDASVTVDIHSGVKRISEKHAHKTTEQDLLVQRAFANAGAATELELQQEKEAEVQHSMKRDKNIQSGDANGWGSWAGFGTEPTGRAAKRQRAVAAAKEREAKKVFKTAVSARKDGKLRSVMLNEKRDKKFTQHLVPDVPHPFTSKEDYLRSVAVPLGKEWNSAHAAEALTRPEVISRAGDIIQPIKFEQLKKQAPGRRVGETSVMSAANIRVDKKRPKKKKNKRSQSKGKKKV